MRRASVVGPLIVILIGILFLARNLYPELPLMDFLSRNWPFILIGWGALRLIEVLFWATTSKALPQRGMGGGEWVLVVFLVLIGSALWEGHRGGWLNRGNIRIGGLEMFGEAFDYPIASEKLAVGKAPEIVIEGFRGNARIAGSSANDVKVTGHKTVRALAQDPANKADKDTKFEIVSNGNQIIIRTNQDRAPNSARVTEDLEITVPKGSSLTAVGRYGDFDINDLDGSVEINSDNAGIRMQNIGGNVRIDTRRSDVIRAVNVKGSMDFKGRGTDLELQGIDGPVTISANYVGMVQFRALSKPVRYEAQNTEFVAEKIPGQVRMTLSDLNGTNLVGPIRLQARSKDVQITDFTQSADINLDRGDVELRTSNAALSKIDVHVRSGAIELAIPEKAKLDLSASTDRGEITNDFGDGLKGDNSGRGATLKGNIGEGPRVVLTTNHGNITVRKSSGADAVSVAPAAVEPPKAPRVQGELKAVEQ